MIEIEMSFLCVNYESNFLGGCNSSNVPVYMLGNWKESIVIEDSIPLIIYSSLKSWQNSFKIL